MAEQPTKAAGSGKSYTKKEAEVSDVELVSPHGTKITVTRRRADELLARQPLTLPGGVRKGYTLASDVDENAKTPMSGTKQGPIPGRGGQ